MKKVLRKNRPSNVIPFNTIPELEVEEDKIAELLAEIVEDKVEPKEQLTVFKMTTPLNDLLEKAREIQKTCKDYTVSASKLSFGGFTEEDAPTLNVENKKLSLRDHAFSQLCGKLGVPVRFMKKCIKEKFYGLACDNIESFRKLIKGNFLVRTNKGEIRGLLSDKYSIMDAPEILEGIMEVMPEAKVKSYYLSDERLHVRILGDKLNVPDEDLFWGIQVDSSDVGRSILKVRFMIYKQVCTNGMVAVRGDGDLFIQKHIGITKTEFVETFKQGVDKIPMVAEIAENLIMQSKLVEVEDEDIQKLVERAIENLSLDKKKTAKLLELVPKYGKNYWGVANALTEFAQDYTLDRRLEIEEYAGRFIA